MSRFFNLFGHDGAHERVVIRKKDVEEWHEGLSKRKRAQVLLRRSRKLHDDLIRRCAEQFRTVPSVAGDFMVSTSTILARIRRLDETLMAARLHRARISERIRAEAARVRRRQKLLMTVGRRR